MPEGDILRRTARTMGTAFTGTTIVRAELRWPSAAGLDLTGRTVTAVSAYGKHLLIRFDDDRTLHTHLRMDGSWRLARTGTVGASGHGPFVRAVLGNERWTAVGHRLGMLDVVATRDEHTLLGHLGPDILAADFPAEGLTETLRRWAARGVTPVGEVLIDQTVVAGIGTLYMAESLFSRGTWPWTPADQVTDPATLLMTARTLMQRSVADDLPMSSRPTGRGQAAGVHGRAGRPCTRCGTRIEVAPVRRPPMERPAFFCPRCQPATGGQDSPSGLSRRA